MTHAQQHSITHSVQQIPPTTGAELVAEPVPKALIEEPKEKPITDANAEV